ncbi:MAG: rSAM/selenodomain-associated transferase 1 [Paraglaciecola sp.]
MKKNNSALLIFIKNIEKGKVKTRLAATVGDDRALAIYQALLGHTRKIAAATDAERYLFYSQFIKKEDAWSNTDFQKVLQIQGDLGEKMAEGFRHAFQSQEKVVIVGSDCASLTAEIVADAFKVLNDKDFVIGPAIDGGYYLIGMRQFLPEVFQGIEWSTAAVFPDTVKKIEGMGNTFGLLPELSDIDFEEDWDKYGWEI